MNGKLIGTHGRAIERANPDPYAPQYGGCKSETRDLSLSTSCGVVARPDHHCGDDLVDSTLFLAEFDEKRLCRRRIEIHQLNVSKHDIKNIGVAKITVF